MPAPSTGPVCLVRACVMAATTVALAVLAHVLGGEALPPVVLLGAITAVALAAAVPLSGRRLGPVAAATVLGVGQVALHETLGAVTSMGCAPVGAAAVHVHGVAAQVSCAAPGPSMGAAPVLGASAMLGLHVVATLVTALLIAGTDRAAAWVVAWLRPLLEAWARTVAVAVASLPTPVVAVRRSGGHRRGVMPLRGPPTVPARVAPAA